MLALLSQADGEGPSRIVQLGPSAVNEEFSGNVIKTAKYNVATFLPIFLFEVFSRAAYLYFLLQVRPCSLSPQPVSENLGAGKVEMCKPASWAGAT